MHTSVDGARLRGFNGPVAVLTVLRREHCAASTAPRALRREHYEGKPMPEGAIRVGLIGANVHAGWGSSVHARVIDALPDFVLVAVGTAHRETAEESARHFGATHAFHDFRELAECPDVDVVAVAVRVPFHHEMVMAALAAGKHVYCEWPLGATLAQAEEMAAGAHEMDVRHVVGLQNRADPVYVEVRRLLHDGYLGELLTCRLAQINGGGAEREQRRTYQADPALGAHTLSISAGHALDSFLFAAGSEFSEIAGLLDTRIPQWRVRETGEIVATASPDNILASGTLAGGATVSIAVAAVPFLGSGFALELYGSEGTITVTGDGGGLALRGGRGAAAELEELPVEDREPVPQAIQRGPTENVGRVYQRLATSIRGEGEAEPSFDTALSLHRVLDAMQRSSATGARVTV